MIYFLGYETEPTQSRGQHLPAHRGVDTFDGHLIRALLRTSCGVGDIVTRRGGGE